jgi:hypothetical protein
VSKYDGIVPNGAVAGRGREPKCQGCARWCDPSFEGIVFEANSSWKFNVERKTFEKISTI